ncbi:MAG: Ig-like domain-containing protein, partial [Longimicrobiales bacterium]|nr:Ig-like domain-containing protein [Longimicrobiales bacterium]
MTSTFPRLAALRPTVLLVSALSLTACGGDDSPTDTVPPPTVAALAFLTAPADPVVGSVVALQVRVDGTDGKPMAGTAVAFSATAGAAAPTSATTDAAGVASVSWTLGTAAGSQTLTASASGKSATATVTARAAAAAVFEKVSGDAQSGAAGDPLKDPLVIAVKDPFANPRPGEALTVAVTGGGSVGSTSATTGSDGRASIVWTLGQALGANTLTVTHALGTVTFTATARPGAPTTVAAISGSGQTAAAGTALANPLVVEVKDRLGHLVSGARVAFVPTVGGGKASADTVTTGADGRAQAQWTMGVTAGAQTLEARIQGATTATFSATAVAGPAAKLEAVSGSGQNGTVGQNLAQPVVAKVSDAFGNGVSGASVAFATPTAGGQPTPAQATTGANGQASSTWKLGNVAGAQTLTASVSGLASLTFTAQAAAGAPAQVRVASGSAQTATVGQALANPLAAEVVDAFGNPVPGVTVTFTPAAGSGAVNPTSGPTGANGRVSTAWTLGTTSGPQTVTASATGATSAPFTATATPGPAASFAKSSGDTQTGQATAPLALPLVVIAKDAFGNGVPGVAVTFAVTGGGGSVNPASGTTGSDGKASTTFTLGSTVGTHTAQASAGVLGNVSFTAAATSGPPSAMSKVSGDAQTRTVGDTLTVTVEVTDAAGNKVPNATVSVSAASGAVAAPPPSESPAAAATASRPTNAQGRATAVWTLGTTAGTQTLTASV